MGTGGYATQGASAPDGGSVGNRDYTDVLTLPILLSVGAVLFSVLLLPLRTASRVPNWN